MVFEYGWGMGKVCCVRVLSNRWVVVASHDFMLLLVKSVWLRKRAVRRRLVVASSRLTMVGAWGSFIGSMGRLWLRAVSHGSHLSHIGFAPFPRHHPIAECFEHYKVSLDTLREWAGTEVVPAMIDTWHLARYQVTTALQKGDLQDAV